MERAWWGIGDPFGEEGSFEEEPFWKPVDEAGFESRFLMEAGRLRDCRTFFARMLGEETAGQAVYDLKQERLVVRAAAADHDAFAEGMRNVIPLQIKVQVSLFEMPFESAQEMGAFWEKAPPEATELASLISLAVPGETATARTTGEALFVESECQVDQGDEYLELRLIARSRKKGQSFVVMSGYTIPLGVTWVEKVGSVDGKKSLVMTIKPDLLLSSGVRVDEWILKENGGAFLREERLQRMRWRQEEKEELKKEGGKVSRNFTVPPTFDTFMLHSKENESEVAEGQASGLEAGEGERLVDVRDFFGQVGVVFREGDYALYSRTTGTLLVKADALQVELIEDIVTIQRGPDPPRLVRLEVAQWAGGQAGQASGERVIRSIGGSVIPGETMTVHLGEDLALEVEGQIDQYDELIELQATLSGSGWKIKKPSFKTGVTVDSGQSLVVQESRIDGKRRAWVLTARVVSMERELDRFLGEGK